MASWAKGSLHSPWWNRNRPHHGLLNRSRDMLDSNERIDVNGAGGPRRRRHPLLTEKRTSGVGAVQSFQRGLDYDQPLGAVGRSGTNRA